MRIPILTPSIMLICSAYVLPAVASAEPTNISTCIITILKLERNGKPFTNGNPPKGTVRIDETLDGPPLPKQLEVVWKPHYTTGCSVGVTPASYQRSVREWESLPFGEGFYAKPQPPFVESAKQIVGIYSDATGRKYIGGQGVFTEKTLAEVKLYIQKERQNPYRGSYYCPAALNTSALTTKKRAFDKTRKPSS